MPPKGKKRAPEPEPVEESSEEELPTSKALSKPHDPEAAKKSVAELPVEIRRRVHALMGLQQQYNDLKKKFVQEQQELEAKYDQLFAPSYVKRAAIVGGTVEPTDEEVAKGSKIVELEEQQASEVKGIPDFWLTALKNNDMIEDMITTRDEEALKALVDVTTAPFENPSKGFTLTFHFADNPFFTNKTLTKKYHLDDEDEDDVLIDKAEGCEINWKEGKNLTVVLKQKKQRHKGSKSVRTVTKAEPCDSFFNFFSPPKLPEDDAEDEEDEGEELEELIERDYEVGVIIKDKIIPRAVLWFTGEAIPPLGFQFGEGEEGEEGEDGDEHPGAPKRVGQEAPECKQQ